MISLLSECTPLLDALLLFLRDEPEYKSSVLNDTLGFMSCLASSPALLEQRSNPCVSSRILLLISAPWHFICWVTCRHFTRGFYCVNPRKVIMGGRHIEFDPCIRHVVMWDGSFVKVHPKSRFLVGDEADDFGDEGWGNTWAPRSIPSAEDEDFNYRFNSISFKGKEGWIVGKPAILLHTSDAGESWERIPLSAQLPGDMVYIKATGEKSAEMVTDQGAIYVTSNRGYNWKAAVQETVSATLNRTVSSGISGASYYTGTFSTVNRSPDGNYVAVSSRGNFYLTWEPGQPYWQPHNRAVARRIQNMGWRADGGLWLLVRGGGLYLSRGIGLTEEFEEVPVQSRGFGILDVGYRSKDEAWAAGGSGILLRTTNGGKSWSRDKAADNIAANLYSVKFIDNKKGFVLGNDGVLLRYLG
ncbi:hypothetical protein Sjap_014507 [Stephania japonica]|uniref:Photosynthesis system II assembly factor Ycf48/Hcf136-like domain-containing protein n=1 Tax=Stephania japonica TaxID=461633 RepID=A0AAP0II44_9MAGN